MNKAGRARLNDGSLIQRWFCRDCNVRFRLPGESQHETKTLKGDFNIPSVRRICVSESEMVNLDAAQQEQAARIPNAPADIMVLLNETEIYMQKQGYAQSTIRTNTGGLRALLARGADLADPESVKTVLAKEKAWSQNRRRNVIGAYGLFLKINGLS